MAVVHQTHWAFVFVVIGLGALIGYATGTSGERMGRAFGGAFITFAIIGLIGLTMGGCGHD